MERMENDKHKPNLMTRETKLRLEAEHKRLQQKLLDAGQQIGEAAGANMDWHDNAAFDQAQAEFKLQGTQEAMLSEKLRNVEIIEPRKETDVVGLGNTVRVRFKDMDEDEMFTILGPDDGLTGIDKNPRWINHKTPLGMAIMGKSKGDTVTFNETQEVVIKDVLPGQFE